MTSESSIKGRGREILLPAQGDPFKEAGVDDEVAIPDPDRLADIVADVPPGASDEPQDLTPEQLAALFPSTYEERNQVPGAELAAHESGLADVPDPDRLGDLLDTDSLLEDEPQDLTPGDLAALFPGTSDERNLVPSAPAEIEEEEAATASAVDADVLAILDEMTAAASEEVAAEETAEPFKADDPFSRGEAPRFAKAAPPPPETAPVAETPTPAVPVAETPSPAPIAAAAEPVQQPQPAAAPAVGSEYALPGVGAQPAADRLDPLAIQHLQDLPETDEMLKLLVSDQTIASLWGKIEALENKVIRDPATSSKDIEANIKRLKAARNHLLSGRQYYEDAERLVAEVEFDNAFKERVRRWSYTWGVGILLYLLFWLGLVALGGVAIGQGILSGLVPQISGLEPDIFLTTLVAGALGGVTGALYSLWVHIARDQDFDLQHRMWYFINPLMGLVLAVFVYWVYFAGILSLATENPSGTSIFLLYVLAWLSGFQQNVALALVRRAIKFLLPKEKS